MRRIAPLLLLVGALAAPAAALAAPSATAVQLGAVAPLPHRPDLIGLRWRGAAEHLELRVRHGDGSWSSWMEVPTVGDGPDPAGPEARRARARIGSGVRTSAPIWVGGVDAIHVRSAAHGSDSPRLLQVVTVDAPHMRARKLTPAAATGPTIRSRSEWGAAAPRGAPTVAEAGIRGAVVHHTAGASSYACSQVPSILRAIQRYHMETQGWNDIGYNLLVDRCGRVWEGRAGGIRQAVVGAHTSGFNTGTVGIAIIGTTSTQSATNAALQALSRTLSWRLDLAHVRPTGRMVLTARSSNGAFSEGEQVAVRAVSGHRDLFATSCPGGVTYRQLDNLASRAWRSGGMKVANAAAAATLRNPADPWDGSLASVRIRAVSNVANGYLTARLVRTSTGEQLHRLATRGGVLAATWNVPDELEVPEWDVTLLVNGARAAPRQRARPLQRQVVPVSSDPLLTLTEQPPDTVGAGDQLQLRYSLARAGQLGAWLVDPVTKQQAAVLAAPTMVESTTTDRLLSVTIPGSIAAGTYELRIGIVDDPARGRSLRQLPVTVTAAT